MKKCYDCNIEMNENYGIRSDEPISIKNKERLYIVKDKNDYFGKRIGKINNSEEVKCRICPKCGKIELYIEPELLDNIK